MRQSSVGRRGAVVSRADPRRRAIARHGGFRVSIPMSENGECACGERA